MWMVAVVAVLAAVTGWSIAYLQWTVVWLRWQSVAVRTRDRRLSPYEVAWMCAGPTRVVEVCLTGMLWSGRLTVTGSRLELVDPVPRDGVESAVVAAFRRSPDAEAWKVAERAARSAAIRSLGEHLGAQGLITPPGALRAVHAARNAVVGLAFGIPIVMLGAVDVALYSHEPAWAAVGTAAAVVGSTVLGLASRRRLDLPPDGITEYGRQVLDALPVPWIPRTAVANADPADAARLGRCARGLLSPEEEPHDLREALAPPPPAPPPEMNDWAGLGI
ncbi:TIGR04222 domain-containing membrane protein [Kitasatospora sp. NPDC093679]|uniref:TIGR04222 domain-containing membrane protein n=1 Tax=Kitasatospora sp. NPDC093679 TaxID=3154983 RepID=UPI003418AFB6